MNQLSIDNVIEVSVAEVGQGLGQFNTSTIGLFSTEPFANSFGTDGYKGYLDPRQVELDFGTSSKTYQMALSVFEQAPNIKAGNGRLVVIAMDVATKLFTPSGVAATGSFAIEYLGEASPLILFSDNAAAIQAKVRQVPGLESVVVTGTIATTLEIEMQGVYGVSPTLIVASNTLQTSAPAAVNFVITNPTPGQTVASAISEFASIVQFFGILFTGVLASADILAAAAVVQTLTKMAGFAVNDPAEYEPTTGVGDLVRLASYEKTRILGYLDTELEAIKFSARYMSRLMSVNFKGSRTTINMHMKTLNGQLPDPAITQVLLDKAVAAGIDTYPSIQGVPKVFTSGANTFVDRVYNLLAFIGNIVVAEFNTLAQTATKIEQTDEGIEILNAADRKVCEQFVTNRFLAPGEWTSPTTFGNQEDLYNNIRQRGYYVYRQPVAEQNVAAREAREAPLAQIALKEAGGVNKSSIVLNINA